MPKKLNNRGEAVPQHKPQAHKPVMPKSGQTITIGRNGKLVTPESRAPHTADKSHTAAGKPNALARPVQRVNRHRNKG